MPCAGELGSWYWLAASRGHTSSLFQLFGYTLAAYFRRCGELIPDAFIEDAIATFGGLLIVSHL
jgi:uncharacterized membrane protein